MRSAFVGFLLVVFFVAGDATHAAGSNHARNKNPYTVLGVSRSAPQDDVRRRYRKLCLEYHPDKKRHLPEKEQKEYEKLFKELQTAYSQIGSSEARRNYDLSERSPLRSDGLGKGVYSFSTSATQQQYDEAMRRAFEGAFRSHHPRSTFYGFSMNDLFNKNNNRSGSPFGFGTSSPLWNPSLKSVYIQKVSVPLQDLYSGKPDYSFTVRDNLISRVMAAFRGGIGFLVLYQSILYALPLIRFSGKLATIVGLYLFYHSIPSAQGSSNNNNLGDHNAPSFTATLRPGYKQGTKLMFDEEQTGQTGVQVHFILNEAKHPTYRRVGNNLHVTCAISHEQAAAGCHVEIPSLSDEGFVLRVEVPEGTTNGDQIVIPGKGWPNRKQKGDLIVTLAVGGIRWWWWRWRGGKANQWQL